MVKKETFGELIRFGIVGTTSAAIHYGIYWVLMHWMNVNVAYTIGYILSFLVNYYLSAHFTFKEKTSAKNGLGFGGAHLTNYLLHIVLLNLFLWLGIHRLIAPILVMAVAMMVQYAVLYLVYHFPKHAIPHRMRPSSRVQIS